jgi:hypothetical protein
MCEAAAAARVRFGDRLEQAFEKKSTTPKKKRHGYGAATTKNSS